MFLGIEETMEADTPVAGKDSKEAERWMMAATASQLQVVDQRILESIGGRPVAALVFVAGDAAAASSAVLGEMVWIIHVHFTDESMRSVVMALGRSASVFEEAGVSGRRVAVGAAESKLPSSLAVGRATSLFLDDNAVVATAVRTSEEIVLLFPPWDWRGGVGARQPPQDFQLLHRILVAAYNSEDETRTNLRKVRNDECEFCGG